MAIVWVAFITLVFLIPPYKIERFRGRTGSTGRRSTTRRSSWAGHCSCFGGWWVLSARKWFKGPVRMGTEEELERYEEELEARTGTAPAPAASAPARA